MTHYIERYWRDATPADAIKEPPMVARFRDDELASWSWESLVLIGYCRKTRIDWRHLSGPWLDTDGDGWACCQVYDVPDPGEGWRLIDVETETPMIGDEIYYKEKKDWLIRQHDKPYDKELTYRRRIEQLKPEPRYEPFQWVDREQLRGRLVTYVERYRTVEFRCELFAVDDGVFSVNYVYADWLCKHARFLDTGEPVGRKIQ